ncbi:MAG: hypothetical protein EA424_04765 [Planctomycetaceae bacterium]|nr:MAG: hypothetical protein EA424_04765 [Planctomycetaceae bacterium]
MKAIGICCLESWPCSWISSPTNILYRPGQPIAAIDLAQAAAATFDEMAGLWPQDWRFGMSATIANRNLARMALETDRLPLATTSLQRASNLARTMFQLDPDDLNLQYNLAAVLVEQGRLLQATGERRELAHADFDRAVERLQVLVGQAPDTATRTTSTVSPPPSQVPTITTDLSPGVPALLLNLLKNHGGY